LILDQPKFSFGMAQMAHNTNFSNISRSIFKRNTRCIHQGRDIQPIIWRNVLNKQRNQKFTSAANLESELNVNQNW